MSRISTLLIGIYFITFININAQVNEADSLAMVDLYYSLNGGDWTNNTNWLSEKPIDEWHGVLINNGRIIALDMKNNNCAGTIESSLSNCSNLIEIFMPDNSISSIEELDSFHFLKRVNLSNNQLTSFPSFILKSKMLERINLYSNVINGNIPASLNNLTQLNELYLSKNKFMGSIPNLKKLKNLKKVEFSLNSLLLGDLSEILFDTLALSNLDISKSGISGILLPTYFTTETNLYLFGDSSNISGISMLEGFNISKAWFRETDLGFGELVTFQDNNSINQYYYNPQNEVESPDVILTSIGEEVTLTCNIEEADVVQWYKDDQEISNAVDANLLINITSMADEGIYHCTGTHLALPQLTIIQSKTEISITTTATNDNYFRSITLFPNPANTYVSLKNLASKNVAIEVFNHKGVSVFSDNNFEGSEIDISSFVSGLYLLKITSDVNGEFKSIPFIKE